MSEFMGKVSALLEATGCKRHECYQAVASPSESSYLAIAKGLIPHEEGKEHEEVEKKSSESKESSREMNEWSVLMQHAVNS